MAEKQKVESPQGNAAGRDIHLQEAQRVDIPSINGGTNFIGNHGPVVVQIGVLPKTRVRAVVQPGPEHIDADQRRQLHDLCDEWVSLHDSIKRSPLPKALAWSRINKAGGSTTYALILKTRFDDARAYTLKQMAILRGMASAPRKDDEWRPKRIGAIKARCINQLRDPHAYKAYIKKNFGADSLTALATDELQKTYAYIMAKKA
ncbi:hypothetical protein [Hydrogenophaga sp.]|uniref:hypothetical protein n=1 Tax=Hydrogenophaga sp. TaxID=1904254 RepID=UPI002734183E|nr:hypothetical protein [Hydrogenophaga sp.]MDP3887038.1 hypothetical protein [Hydrogenophaga sp.]